MDTRPALGLQVVERDADAADQRFVTADDRASPRLECKRRDKEHEQRGDRDQYGDQTDGNAEPRHLGVDQHHRADGEGDDPARAERTKRGKKHFRHHERQAEQYERQAGVIDR